MDRYFYGAGRISRTLWDFFFMLHTCYVMLEVSTKFTCEKRLNLNGIHHKEPILAIITNSNSVIN